MLIKGHPAAKLNVALAEVLPDTLATPPYLPGLLADIEVEFAFHPVGSNPKGADATNAKLLLNQLNEYFATVGEEKCPIPDAIPEAP